MIWPDHPMSEHEERSRRYEEVWAAIFGPAPTLREIFEGSGYQWTMALHWTRCEGCGAVLIGESPETIEHCPRCCNCYECGESLR